MLLLGAVYVLYIQWDSETELNLSIVGEGEVPYNMWYRIRSKNTSF